VKDLKMIRRIPMMMQILPTNSTQSVLGKLAPSKNQPYCRTTITKIPQRIKVTGHKR